MPLFREDDIGAEFDFGPACVHCVGPDGKIRDCGDVFLGGVDFFVNNLEGVSRELAERVTRRNMRSLPYWRGREGCGCLDGDEATEEEFDSVLSKLMNR
ncbi:hypothetical protein JW899_02440 [Candidatus Uhrbacteria bacterium]|nr:hypothetical protein [Candidatus Uhrbacteria bacterium]